MYCSANVRGINKSTALMSRRHSSYSRRAGSRASRLLVVAAAGVGAMKLASNRLNETHEDISQSLSAPYDKITENVNAAALRLRLASTKGRNYFDEITWYKNPASDAVNDIADIIQESMLNRQYYSVLSAGDVSADNISMDPPLSPQQQELGMVQATLDIQTPVSTEGVSETHLDNEAEIARSEQEEALVQEKEALALEILQQKEALARSDQEKADALALAEKEKEEAISEVKREQEQQMLRARQLEEEYREQQSKIEEEKCKLVEELAFVGSVASKSETVLKDNEELKNKINAVKADSHKTETELRKELLKLQESYKKELDRIRSENDQLKYFVKNSNLKNTTVKKSIIDMYAEVLDTLSEADSSYEIQDHLPRIVVVGDQSAGKTSVLEMIVRARIFPRGHGEMMTRAPVQVTLGEGNRHTAQFSGSDRVYVLSSETELCELRAEVERRMVKNLKSGDTVSTEVIPLTVKGPGLHRMVLVDLPGIISTETSGMRPRTKETLTEICSSYMRNPNAIILCVQDGSIDAERSNVTSIVQAHDPKGKRTIFVLTKVDLAEQNMANPTRVKKILEGKLFPMKALGYYAVVTGRGSQEDSIETIRAYEEDFFSRSTLFRSGAMRASQMSTNNLTLAVSHCFWKMVSDSVEQQADNFKAARYNLEAEWRNTFAGIREMDRNDLYEKARDDILDDISSLHKLTPLEWETLLQESLWEKIHSKVVDDIYLAAAESTSPSHFNTKVDIALKDWTDHVLPQKSIEVGWQTLFKQLENIMLTKRTDREIGDLFQPLKANILETVKAQHNWQSTALKRLSVIQKNALEDTAVTNKMQWDNSISFMERILQDRIDTATDQLEGCIGPGWRERWTGWRSRTPLETQCVAAKNELQKLLMADESHGKHLENDELTTVRRNLQTQGVDVPYEIICTVWEKLYKLTFLNRALTSAQQCRKAFYHRSVACNAVECNDVVLFWRATRMLEITANALRLQIMNTEAQRLEKEVKQYLEELSRDEDKKKELIIGKRVDLAEELRRVRNIQDRLDAFIDELSKEQQT